MKIDYLTSNHKKVKRISLKQSVLALFFMLSVSFGYSQSITIQTISSLDPWNITVANSGPALTWDATGAVIQTRVGNNVDFDFSSNVASGNITITSTGSLNGITALNANDLVEISPPIPSVFQGQRIFSIDVSSLPNLQVLNLDNNSLIALNVLSNLNLTTLSLANNGSITSLDLSANNLLTNLNMENTSLTSVEIDNILNTLDAFGTLNGFVNFDGISTGNITANGIQAYINLIAKGWSIIPPQGFDRGDAPDTYFTSLGNNGPIHFYDELDDNLRIGLTKDNDLNRPFGPSVDADGDDNDPIGTDDEDGVDETQFNSFFHTNINFSLDVQLVNTLPADSYLHAWIDFDRNGTFDTDEHASIVVSANTSGVQTLNWDVSLSGADVNFGKSFARFRYTSDNSLDSSSVGGIVNGGEVEDYTFVMLDGTDTDLDGVPDSTDVDDDNDGILDTVEEDGDINRDTDGDGILDRIDFDSDGDGCADVDEAGFENNGNDMLGTANPPIVDGTGLVTSVTPGDGYTPPADANGNGTPDFQEAGVAANITTQPVDQIFVLAGSSTFSVVTDLVAGDESYQWEESLDNGVTWNTLVDGGDYAGTTTADLIVSTPDFSKVFNRYRILVSNIAYACDPVTTSTDVTFITPGDFDKDGVFDVVDFDDDNDGILDNVEDNGVVDRDTDGDGFPDRIDLDADDDGCFDVDEAGFTDDNGDGMLGDFPITVDVNGQVTSGSDGYTPPDDADGSGTPDFQEAGAAATITTEPTDQNLIIGVNTFSVVATADTYQWEESQDGGTTWAALVDGGDYAGTTTADLMVTNSDVTKLTFTYRVIVNNIAYACDPTTTSAVAGFIAPSDFDLDGIFDIVDVDDDNDGILDTVEDNGVVDRDTDGDGTPDRIQLDADADGCFDVTEAGFTDGDGDGMLGSAPITVDVAGQVTSGTDGYTPPNDLDGSGTPDFQEAGAAAAITTQPVDQNLIPGNTAIFSVVATADTYSWEESQDGGTTWVVLIDQGDYSGTTTADLTIANLVVGMNSFMYRATVSNLAYACDPTTVSDIAQFVILTDTDNDGIPDLIDVDDDNDGILDTVEDNGVVDRDTDGNGDPDRIQLDADADGCFDVTEAGFTDGDGDGMLGSAPITVDAAGQVTSGTDGYTPPNDLDGNGTPDFQEAGIAATITTDPIDQDFILNGTAIFTAAGSGDTFQWEVSTDGVNWNLLTDDATYSGTTTTSLTVTITTINTFFEEYRMQSTNIAFACDPGANSLSASYNSLADTDNDGVFDIIDVDDDNDGIFDTVEGEFTDSNLDGTPDRISLDADSDGCADTVEAGFDDPDGDGVLGSSPVIVDANGQVTGQGGYTTPNDLDGNGVFDFQEAGSASEINNEPEDVTVDLGNDAIFEISGNATFYQWQVSVDAGTSWSNLVNDQIYSGVDTDRLIITEARGRLERNMYRVILSSPDYACDPNIELISNEVRLIFSTEVLPSGFSPNGDGINDVFSLPGLIESPDFTMEVFDRWGNSVYKYANNGNLSPDWWDGRSTGNMNLSSGELVPAGTYFYLIQFKDGDKPHAKGWVYVNY